MELFITIVTLCGNPGYTRLTQTDVINCQKYFTQCVIKENKSPNAQLLKLSHTEYVVNALSKCVMERN